MVFAGEQFENDADFKLAKSMLLDMFRGRVVEKINLKVHTFGILYRAPSALTQIDCWTLTICMRPWRCCRAFYVMITSMVSCTGGNMPCMSDSGSAHSS